MTFTRGLERRHDSADHVLCVVSDDYQKAPYSSLERNAALWQAANKRPRFVLLVVVKPCKLPTLADHIRRCEIFGVPEDTARVRFRNFIAIPDIPETAMFPGNVYAVSNIPLRLPIHFMGRDDALDAIDEALRRGQGRAAITALHGLRGVGKTTLAVAYAERHLGDYRAIWWIRAQADSTMRADIAALGFRLDWVPRDEKENEAFAITVERLRYEGDSILLIFDNALNSDAMIPYLPRGGTTRALITSNAHAWRGIASPVEIRVWQEETGADYLIARTGRVGERDAAQDLSGVLGGLPLAHEQAAAYCERLDVALAEYRKRFEAAPASLLDDERHAPAEYYDGLTVAKTFALAIDQATVIHPAADTLLTHAAFLSPEPIPLFVFTEAVGKFEEPLANMIDGNGIEDHPLTAMALSDLAMLEQQERNLSKARSLFERALEIFERRQGPTHRHTASTLNRLAQVLVRQGDLEDAKLHYNRSLTINEGTLGTDNSITNLVRSNLAQLCFRLGDRVEGLALGQMALECHQKSLGADHYWTGNSARIVADMLSALGRKAEAAALRTQYPSRRGRR